MRNIILNRVKSWDNWLVVLFLVVLIGFFHGSNLNKYPTGIHTWANMDRIALARGFERNNLNFFKAQNYILNHQFPSYWSVPSESTRTAVEFPIHDYIPAVFMKLTGQSGPVIFHFYILIFSFLGLLYLYRLAKLITDNKIKSFFVLIFAALAPNYIFYQGGFLPTIPSISLVIFALYNYARFYKIDNKRHWFWMMSFLTIAVLARSTYAIPLVAILSFEGLRTLRLKLAWKYKLVSIGISFGLIFLSLKYNAYVRNLYGSDFLSELLPSKSWNEVKNVMHIMFDSWRFSYLTYKHYLVLFGLLLLTPFSILFFKNYGSSMFIRWWGLLGIWLIGVLVFWFVMNQQFIYHDYYFLDTMYLPLLLFLILALHSLPKFYPRFQKIALLVVSVVFGYFAFIETRNFQNDRAFISDWDTVSGTVLNFENAETWLNELGIPKSAKIMVMHAYGPNIPFVLMNRTGYACKEYKDSSEFKRALNWNWDYVVFQKPYFNKDVYQLYPDILSQVEPIALNAKLILCKRKTNNKSQELIEFLGYKRIVKQFHADFKANSMKAVNFVARDSLGIISSNVTYGFGMDFTSYYKNGSSLLIRAKLRYKLKKADKIPLIVALNDGDKLAYYAGMDFTSEADSLTTQELFVIIPSYNLAKPKLSAYFYNPAQNEIELHNLDIELLTESIP